MALKRDPEIHKLVLSIQKSLGEDSFQIAGDPDVVLDVIPTGAPTLDAAIGIGGIPRGRITEIYGAESSTKTSLALSIVANAQKLGLLTAYIDMEQTVDARWAQVLGVDLDRFYSLPPPSGNKALDLAKKLIESHRFGLIIVDSIPALVTEDELAVDMSSESRMGRLGFMLSTFFKKVNPSLGPANTALVFINQIRANLSGYGRPTTRPGGHAIRYYESLLISLSAPTGKQIKEGDVVVGLTVTARIEKNKMAPPFKSASYDFIFNKGIDQMGGLFDTAFALGILKKAGGWYKWDEENFSHGRPAGKERLRAEPETRTAIEAAIKQILLDQQAGLHTNNLEGAANLIPQALGGVSDD